MNIIIQTHEQILIRLDMGEELIASLGDLLKKSVLHAASFTAIGACREIVLSYYNLETKTYEDHVIQEDMEITGITGNIGYMEQIPVVHAHGTFGKKDLSVVGGHIKKLTVSATCEVMLQILPSTIERAYDEKTGLNLIRNSC